MVPYAHVSAKSAEGTKQSTPSSQDKYAMNISRIPVTVIASVAVLTPTSPQ